MIKPSSVHEISEMLDTSKDCQVIDVREFSEFNSEHVANSRLMPLSNFEKLSDQIDRSKPVYLMCRSGTRAKQAAEKLIKRGFTDIHVVNGGISAWSAAKLPLVKGKSKVWSLERQVRFTAGLLMLVGVVLGYSITAYFLVLSAVVGGGLVFSAVTDTCGMGLLLAKMPWNKEHA